MLSSVSLNTPSSCAPHACSRSMRAPKSRSCRRGQSYLTQTRLGRRTSRKLHPAFLYRGHPCPRQTRALARRPPYIGPEGVFEGFGMVAVWIGGALLLGLAVSRIGLPPLVGFLASGFVFAALGIEHAPMLEDIARAGVLPLLFAVGLKLRIKTLLRYEVWGTALGHLVVTGVIGVAAAWAGGWLSPSLAFVLAVSFGLSSTVLAAKVLEGNRELRAVHGRVAIGILIVQDIVAVVLLAFVNAETPSPWALLLLLVPFTRPVIAWVLARCGHGELLVLCGAALAIGAGEAFEAFGLSAYLGALLLGTMLADHRRAQELTNVLWGLKELFLVGFFLNIGFKG